MDVLGCYIGHNELYLVQVRGEISLQENLNHELSTHLCTTDATPFDCTFDFDPYCFKIYF